MVGLFVRIFLIVYFFFFYLPGTYAGEVDSSRDSVPQPLIKKGWNVAPFPAVGYSSDLGFQYGIYGELYDFGDGSLYPGYRNKFCIEASRYTKGSAVLWFFYDSPVIWKDHRITFDIGWFPDRMLDFYGYNGYVSPFRNDENNSFYKIDRKQLRVTFNLSGTISGHLNWMAGISYQRIIIKPVTLKKYAGEDNLYTHYMNSSLIHENEASGGNVLQWKAGIIYDSRDREADPTKGWFGEFILALAPDWIDRAGYSFVKTNISLCRFQPLYKDRITFAARVGAQFTPLGNTPFYFLSNINTIYLRQTYSEGLGGIANLRGILRNRIVGKGMGWINAEIRLRSGNFRFLKQNWYIGLNPFIDAGRVLQYYRKDIQKHAPDVFIWSHSKENIHADAGLGGKIVMNDNFVLSGEWARAFDSRDGVDGLILGLNYLF